MAPAEPEDGALAAERVVRYLSGERE